MRAQAPEQQEPSIAGPESTRSPQSPWKKGVRESPRPTTQRVPSSTKSDKSSSINQRATKRYPYTAACLLAIVTIESELLYRINENIVL